MLKIVYAQPPKLENSQLDPNVIVNNDTEEPWFWILDFLRVLEYKIFYFTETDKWKVSKPPASSIFTSYGRKEKSRIILHDSSNASFQLQSKHMFLSYSQLEKENWDCDNSLAWLFDRR